MYRIIRSNHLTLVASQLTIWKSFQFTRTFTSSSSSSLLDCKYAQLKSKTIISITGQDSFNFLQGLVTNDVQILTNVCNSCIYAFMLNDMGRILADFFIYKYLEKDDTYFLEVDKNICDKILKLLKFYKIKRKISIIHRPEYNSFVCFPNDCANFPNIQVSFNDCQSETILSQDPRNFHFGYKILSAKPLNCNDFFQLLIENSIYDKPMDKLLNVSNANETCYRSFRYQYGIGEGVLDLPDMCFPFEANGDLLNGINFNKGCYIGQEFISTTFNYSVIRKRIMPIEILSEIKETDILPLQKVINYQGKTIGSVHGNLAKYGLALMRFNAFSQSDKIKLSISQYPIKAWRPFWWPKSLL